MLKDIGMVQTWDHALRLVMMRKDIWLLAFRPSTSGVFGDLCFELTVTTERGTLCCMIDTPTSHWFQQ